MAKDLTSSKIDRQNILNNELALNDIQAQTGIQGIFFENKIRFTKSMVASFFDVDVRTIERCVSDNLDEITNNGYELIKGERLKKFLACADEQDAPDIDVGSNSNRTSQI